MSGLSGDAELCVTELVTNVMRHVPDRRCTVRVFREDGGVLVEVRDSSPVLPTLRRAELLEESGRGIATVDLLAHEWGAEPAEGGGKVVWFRMRVRPPVG
jgi:anti-sigma regulatory factor (Ser/Thr protein kinase)